MLDNQKVTDFVLARIPHEPTRFTGDFASGKYTLLILLLLPVTYVSSFFQSYTYKSSHCNRVKAQSSDGLFINHHESAQDCRIFILSSLLSVEKWPQCSLYHSSLTEMLTAFLEGTTTQPTEGLNHCGAELCFCTANIWRLKTVLSSRSDKV